MNATRSMLLGLLVGCVGVPNILAQDGSPQPKAPEKGAVREEGKVEKAAAQAVAPDFTLTDSEGKQHKLADLKDKIVVLEWTNKGCPYVLRHVKEKTMTTLATEYAAKGVVWLAIDSTASNAGADVETWRQESGISYPVLLDPTGMVGHAYDAKTTPHLFIVRNGTILYSGAIDDNPRGSTEKPTNYVRKALDEITGGKSVSMPKVAPYGCSVKYRQEKDAN